MKTREIKNSIIAKVLGYNIVLYPFILYKGNPTLDIIAHELKHIEQIKHLGVSRFYLSYLLYYFAELVRGRSSYWAYRNIPYEIEAYQIQIEVAKI